MSFLTFNPNHPLEREYEGWIIRCIEDYFELMNRKVVIEAVSPTDEKIFPADDRFTFNHKTFALQLKRCEFAQGMPREHEHLMWKLENNQFQKIRKHAEIYYCLPTFVNRDYRRNALDHCIFWRPQEWDKMGGLYYLLNDESHKRKRIITNEQRWGGFIEDVLRCKKGRSSGMKAIYDTNLNEPVVEFRRDKKVKGLGATGGLYLITIEMPFIIP